MHDGGGEFNSCKCHNNMITWINKSKNKRIRRKSRNKFT
jgi:hypothetical protein